MPRYSDPDTGKSIFSDTPLSENEIMEGLQLTKGTTPLPIQQPSIPQRLWTGAGKNIADFYNAPSIIRSLGGLLEGGIETGIRALQPAGPEYPASPRGQAFEQGIVNPLAQEIAKQRQDPFGYMMDVPGKMVNYAIDNPVNTLMNVAPFMPKNVAPWVNPLSLATKPVTYGLNKIAQSNIPESIFLRTSKIPSGSVSQPIRQEIASTMVRKEKIPLGATSVDKMTNIVGELEPRITQALKNLSEGQVWKREIPTPGTSITGMVETQLPYSQGIRTVPGQSIDVSKIANALDELKGKYKNSLDADAYFNTIEEVKQKIINKAFNNDGKISLIEAHNIKKGIYGDIQSYYKKRQMPETGRVGIKSADEAAAQAKVAQVIRQEILDNPLVPNMVKQDMAREAGIMQARKWVERATNRAGNLEVMDLSGMLFGVLVEHGVGGAIAWRVAKSQPVMSRLAISLAKTRKPMGGMSTAIPYIATEVTDPYVDMANEWLNNQ